MSKYNPDIVIGIDCGTGGAIAYYKDKRHTAVKMPKDVVSMQSYFQYLKDISSRPLAFVERQQPFAADLNSGRMFRARALLNNYERIQTLLQVMEIPYATVPPITWQSRLKIHKKGEEYSERKKRYSRVAADQCQTIKSTLWNADALLITQFGRYILAYEPEWLDLNIVKSNNDIFK